MKLDKIFFLTPRSKTASLYFAFAFPKKYAFFVDTFEANSKPSISGELINFFLNSSRLSISVVIAAFIAPFSLIYLTKALVSTSEIAINFCLLNHESTDLDDTLELT